MQNLLQNFYSCVKTFKILSQNVLKYLNLTLSLVLNKNHTIPPLQIPLISLLSGHTSWMHFPKEIVEQNFVKIWPHKTIPLPIHIFLSFNYIENEHWDGKMQNDNTIALIPKSNMKDLCLKTRMVSSGISQYYLYIILPDNVLIISFDTWKLYSEVLESVGKLEIICNTMSPYYSSVLKTFRG